MQIKLLQTLLLFKHVSHRGHVITVVTLLTIETIAQDLLTYLQRVDGRLTSMRQT
ncbi:hypothetical protein Hanom_Chr12g01138281 [Helianthus anomalus]